MPPGGACPQVRHPPPTARRYRACSPPQHPCSHWELVWGSSVDHPRHHHRSSTSVRSLACPGGLDTAPGCECGAAGLPRDTPSRCSSTPVHLTTARGGEDVTDHPPAPVDGAQRRAAQRTTRRDNPDRPGPSPRHSRSPPAPIGRGSTTTAIRTTTGTTGDDQSDQDDQGHRSPRAAETLCLLPCGSVRGRRLRRSVGRRPRTVCAARGVSVRPRRGGGDVTPESVLAM